MPTRRLATCGRVLVLCDRKIASERAERRAKRSADGPRRETRHSEQRTIASKSLATRPLVLAWIAPVTSDAEPKATAAPWP